MSIDESSQSGKNKDHSLFCVNLMAKTIRGVKQREELNPVLSRRDVRPLGRRFLDVVESGEALIIVLGLSLGGMLIFPQIMEIIGLFAILFFYWAQKQKFTLAFRLPIKSRLIDPGDFKAGTSIPVVARGIAFLGNEMGSNRELWFNKMDMCTHILVFGSTGAGKALRMKEQVLTSSGWKEMKDIRLGDQVVTPNRQLAQVVDIFPQGFQPLWRMEFDDGRFIDVTSDHLWGVSKIVFDDSWAPKDLPLSVQETMSTDDIEQRLFDRENLKPNEHLAIPLTEAVGDAVAVWSQSVEEMAQLVEQSLLQPLVRQKDDSVFPSEWIEGSVIQRQQTWNKIKKIGTTVGPHTSFDSANIFALESIQRLAWSLGFWAKIEPWKDQHSLTVDTEAKWLKISQVSPLHVEEECQCIKISTEEGLFVTKDWLVTHNTETLISLAYNTLVTGSGFIYVDGKGDNSLWAKIFSVVRFLGREDDLLVINFMTGGKDMSGPQSHKGSNTLNPFIVGSAAGLTELLVGLMDEAGGDNAMWKGRAISLISALMLALVHLRDHDGLLMGVEVIRDHLLLENIQKLSKQRDLPAHILQSVKAYLRSLPGYNENAPKQSETVMDQHGYLQMQFTRILGSLADIYGYIFKTNLGEVDFFDIVLNRRILVVLLPAMEKSTDELANLGKIIVACLKQMMATGLGDVLEGRYEDVIETKPTSSPAPFMCILDEYGYYVVKGASVMPAQARSLGFCMVFAGQDYPAFKKNNNAEEAVSTIGNCNIKIFMKLEDPTETFDLAEKSIGESDVGKTSGLQRAANSSTNSYLDGQNASIERRKRVDWLDFKDHAEGEAHIIFKSTLVRANMFFADPVKVEDLQLNNLLRVEPPHHSELQEWDETLAELRHKIVSQQQIKDIEADTLGSTPARLKKVAQTLQNSDHPPMSGIEALQSIFTMAQQNASNMSEKTKQAVINIKSLNELDEDEEKEGLHIFRKDLEDEDEDEDEDDDIWSTLRNNNSDEDEDEDEDEDDDILLSEKDFRDGLEQVEQGLGISPDEAQRRSESIAADMRVISSYPKVSPDPLEPDEFSDFIEELDAKLAPNQDDD